MTLRIAINGFGRIGRNVLRALYTQGYRQTCKSSPSTTWATVR